MSRQRPWEYSRRAWGLSTGAARQQQRIARHFSACRPPALKGRCWPVLVGIMIMVSLGGLLVITATGQFKRPAIVINGTSPMAGISPTVSLPEDRDAVRKLKIAKDQLAAKNWNEAVRLFGLILESPEDYFFKPDPNGKSYVSIRREAERLLGTLPEEGRKAFELRYDAPARRMLEEAVASGDLKKLQEISGKLFHTAAGYQATLLLGQNQLDTGQALAAALTFERLLKAPAKTRAAMEPELSVKLAASWYLAQRPDKARQALLELKRSYPNATISIAGREIGLFGQGTDPLVWLQPFVPGQLNERPSDDRNQLLVRRDAPRGGAGSSHNAQLHFEWLALHYANSDGSELASRPSLGPVEVDKGVAEFLRSTAASFRQQNLGPMSAMQPLVVGDKVVMRTATGLWGIDLNTGERLWPFYASRDEVMIDLVKKAAGQTTAPTTPTPNPALPPGIGGLPRQSVYPSTMDQQQVHVQLRNQALTQRVFMDATYGSMSSDGRLVYVIDELPVFKNYPYWGGFPGGMPSGQAAQQSHNRLRAYSLAREGKVMWELGGKKGQSASPLAGAFFLGPPLPLGGRLFVIAEANGQIALHAVEQQDSKVPRDGPKIAWTQPLCNVEQRVDLDFVRQTAGISPAYADGILVCPTAAGAVVAVDLTSRSLLWAYTYGRDELTNAYGGGGAMFEGGRVIMRQQYLQAPHGWADTGVIIAEGKVLVTERGNKGLHCLNMEDGSRAWEVTRGDSLYVGGVHEGNVVVVGVNYVRAQKLADGAPAWRVNFPNNAKTAGRGFHHGGVYVVPLDDGQIASVEMKTGDLKLTDEKVVQEGRGFLGNLVSVNGWVLSQDLTGVQGFRQISLEALLQSLKAKPNDVNVLTQLGELLRQKGRHEEAIGYLRRAAELSKTASAKRLLTRALVQALQRDFAQHRALAGELESLTSQTDLADLRGDYLRTLSEGLYALKDYAGTVDAMLKLTDFDAGGGKLQQVTGTLALRHDRWVQAQMDRFQREAPPEARDKIASAIAARIKAAGPNATPEVLRRLLDYFDAHPLADELRSRLAGSLLDQKQSRLEVELLLRRLERSTDAQQARAAVARLAEFYRTADEWPRQSHGFTAAKFCFDRLKGELAGAVCLNGKTGKQLFEQAVKGDENFRAHLEAKPWPTGHVKVQSAENKPSEPWRPGQQSLPIHTTLDDPLTGHLRFLFRNPTLYVQNELGRPLWQVSLQQFGSTLPSSIQYGHRLAARGHLVVFVTGYEIIGIDASPGTPDDKRLLWRHSLTRVSELEQSVELIPQVNYEAALWGPTTVRFQNRMGQLLGSLRPVIGSRQVVFLRGAELISVDALTGDPLWKRGGMELGSDVFGDDEVLFVAGPESGVAKMFRAADGAELGNRDVPERAQRLTTTGSRVLAWTRSGDNVELKLVDVAASKTLWSQSFSSMAKANLAGPDEVAVLDNRNEELARAGRHFQVFSIADGKLRFAAPLEECKEIVHTIYVLRSRDRYVLAVNSAGVARVPLAGGFRVMNFGGSQPLDQAQIAGHVFGFQRPGGRRMWHWEVAGHNLPLSQPSECPVVAFVTPTYSTRAVAGRGTVGVYQTSVALVDRRSGRVLHKEAIANPQTANMASFELSAGPGHKVRFVHPAREITLTFTDEARPKDAKDLDLTLAVAAISGTPGGRDATGGIVPAEAFPAPPRPAEPFRVLPRTVPKSKPLIPKER